jgi:hypothetical protein
MVPIRGRKQAIPVETAVDVMAHGRISLHGGGEGAGAMLTPQQTDSLKKKRMPEICRLQVVDVDNKLLLPPWLGCKRTSFSRR